MGNQLLLPCHRHGIPHLISITELNRIDKTPLAFEGKTFSGEYLMQNGLEIPYGHNADWGKANEWASRVLLLEEVK